MKIVLQRVRHASVEVDKKVVGEIDKGLLLLVGFTHQDDEKVIATMVEKVLNLRIFEDEVGKMNLSLLDLKLKVLSISQFTLYADYRKGRRPSFTNAAKAEDAIPLYQFFNNCIRKFDVEVEEGKFGAQMDVNLLNDGPVTICLDSEELK